MRKLKLRRATELVKSQTWDWKLDLVLILCNDSCHSEETRSQEIYISNLKTGTIPELSGTLRKGDRGFRLWTTVLERGEGCGKERKRKWKRSGRPLRRWSVEWVRLLHRSLSCFFAVTKVDQSCLLSPQSLASKAGNRSLLRGSSRGRSLPKICSHKIGKPGPGLAIPGALD